MWLEKLRASYLLLTPKPAYFDQKARGLLLVEGCTSHGALQYDTQALKLWLRLSSP